MVERRIPISVSDAVERTVAGAKRTNIEQVTIDECDGRILAEDLFADHDVPPFDRSPYDGFALRAEDTTVATESRPAEFHVVAEIAAGEVAAKGVESGQAARIMTGAPIPQGADAIVMLEHVHEFTRDGEAFFSVRDVYRKDQNVSHQGEDTKEGDVQVKRGTRITPGVKAVLATFGYAKVKVYRKPVVGIFATGTELLDVGEPVA
ncbi:MAG TPA: molybdopterin molybdenumtransferase MoeA, partial [Bacillales bacterium]|nr:molybdopterin molybdenumtransferase MoeA [Bacillales bacterium]